jgi:hypothetical protein
MHYDVTLITHASRPVSRPLPPDVRELRDHLEAREPRMLQLRRSLSAGLIRLAERVDPRPARTERDELFDAISALLAEPKCEAPRLETASHRGCSCVL